ncbi:MAG: hypothetical protein IPN67_04365 [Bacteroidales bacterium]|nr:hypothetical protein [Bacteroidales bacterium]
MTLLAGLKLAMLYWMLIRMGILTLFSEEIMAVMKYGGGKIHIRNMTAGKAGKGSMLKNQGRINIMT